MTREPETEIARQTAAGREMLAVLASIRRKQTGEQRLEKAFELTEMTRQIMRDGIRASHPDWTEDQIHAEYVDRLLSIHGLSVAKIRQMQKREARET